MSIVWSVVALSRSPSVCCVHLPRGVVVHVLETDVRAWTLFAHVLLACPTSTTSRVLVVHPLLTPHSYMAWLTRCFCVPKCELFPVLSSILCPTPRRQTGCIACIDCLCVCSLCPSVSEPQDPGDALVPRCGQSAHGGGDDRDSAENATNASAMPRVLCLFLLGCAGAFNQNPR